MYGRFVKFRVHTGRVGVKYMYFTDPIHVNVFKKIK